MTKPNTKSIVEALSKFQQEANVAVKDKKNPYFKSNYAGLEDVIAAANQGAKFGLAFTQTIDFEKQIYLYNLNENGTPGFEVINPLSVNQKNYLINRGWIPFEKKGMQEINEFDEKTPDLENEKEKELVRV